MSFSKVNKDDWQYLSVRRKLLFLEQSIKLAMQEYVFDYNNKNTWQGIKSTITSFLTNVWEEGGLYGDKASNAFNVKCGLGTTMTNEDLEKGLIKVDVKVAIVNPKEFIILSFQQEQATSS